MDKQSIVQVTLKANEELIKRTKQKSKRSFYMVGKESWINIAEKGQKADWQFSGIDFIEVFAAMSKREQAVVVLLKNNILWNKEMNSLNFIIELSPENTWFNPEAHNYMPYNTFLKGFNLLYKKDLVRRVRRHQYMFNPEFLIPSGEQSAYFEQIWAESKSYGDTK